MSRSVFVGDPAWVVALPRSSPSFPARPGPARLYERLAGLPADPVAFVDLDLTGFSYDHVRPIYELGVTAGQNPSTFDPCGLVTREQTARSLRRLYAAIPHGGSA